MNIHVYTFHKFQPLLILPINTKKSIYSNLRISKIIPIEWQLILINEGSFTETLNALTGKEIKVTMSQKYNNITRNIRCVWLETSIYTKLTFARSLWLLIDTKQVHFKLTTNQPIGKSFIHNKIDIYRNLHEIYYGYCKYLEKQFLTNQPIWGRKYTIYYNYDCNITIQEFFSPYIIKLFK